MCGCDPWCCSAGVCFGCYGEGSARTPVRYVPGRPARRACLVAARSGRDGVPVFTLDIRLAGEGETVFLDV